MTGSELIGRFSWKRALSFTGKQRWKLFAIAGSMVLQAALTPCTPLVVAEIIDNGFADKSRFAFSTLLIFLFVLSLLQVLVHTLQDILITSYSSWNIHEIRVRLFEQLQKQSLGFFTNRKQGEIMSRLTTEANMIGESAIKPIIYSFQTSFGLIVTIVMMFVLDWRLASLILLLTPFLFVPLPLIGRFTYRISKRLVEMSSDMNTFISEHLSVNGIMLNKLHGRKNKVNQMFMSLIGSIRKLTMSQAYLGGSFNLVFTLGTACAPIFIYWFGKPGGAISISAGTAVAFSSYISSLFNPLQGIGRIGILMQSVKVNFERLMAYLDEGLDSAIPEHPVTVSQVKGRVSFEQVSYSYTMQDPVIQEVSFHIEPREKFAIVGYSGSGKTTIAYLLTKLVEPTAGTVKIDGIDIRDIHPDDIPAYVGLVSQDIYLFHTTVRENILLAKPDASEEELIAAAKSAFIHDKISSLPEGYDTVVGERGYKFSGGEKQRIAIARVLLQNPPILILDEATSALDMRSEAYVHQAVRRLSEERTVIVITHRIAALEGCSRAMVMDKGRVVELGTGQELLAKDGLFARLYHSSEGNDAFLQAQTV